MKTTLPLVRTEADGKLVQSHVGYEWKNLPEVVKFILWLDEAGRVDAVYPLTVPATIEPDP